jgi:hypothetical protein
MIKLNWIPSWQAYAVRVDGKLLGLVRCKVPFPFRLLVEIA